MKMKLKRTLSLSTQQTEISSQLMTVAGLRHDGFGVVLTLFVCYQYARFERRNLVKVFPHPGWLHAYGLLPVCIRLVMVSFFLLKELTGVERGSYCR